MTWSLYPYESSFLFLRYIIIPIGNIISTKAFILLGIFIIILDNTFADITNTAYIIIDIIVKFISLLNLLFDKLITPIIF